MLVFTFGHKQLTRCASSCASRQDAQRPAHPRRFHSPSLREDGEQRHADLQRRRCAVICNSPSRCRAVHAITSSATHPDHGQLRRLRRTARRRRQLPLQVQHRPEPRLRLAPATHSPGCHQVYQMLGLARCLAFKDNLRRIKDRGRRARAGAQGRGLEGICGGGSACACMGVVEGGSHCDDEQLVVVVVVVAMVWLVVGLRGTIHVVLLSPAQRQLYLLKAHIRRRDKGCVED